VGGVATSTVPNAVGRFPVRLRGNTVGQFTQTFGLMQEGVAWFADRGGPADTFITVRVDVVPRAAADAGVSTDAGVTDAGVSVEPEPQPIEVSALAEGTVTLPAAGCGCTTVDPLAWGALAGLVLFRRRRRAVEAGASIAT
jgi:MYXO-CTERM domain-containing protein